MSELGQLLKQAVGMDGQNHISIWVCEVISVNEQSRTCSVEVQSNNSEIVLDNVMLMYGVNDGKLLIPAVESTVIVCNTAQTQPFVILFSEIDKVVYITGNTGLQFDTTGMQFNDGGYGGLAIVKDPDNDDGGVKERLNKIENKVNSLLDNWNQFCQDYVPGSPSVTGLPAALASSTVTPSLTLTTESDISNPNITHGNKLVQ